MQIQISWLLQMPTDLDLHCLLRQGMSCYFHQLASSEANWSGSTLFAKTGHVKFSKRRVNSSQLQQMIFWFFYSKNKGWHFTWICLAGGGWGRGKRLAETIWITIGLFSPVDENRSILMIFYMMFVASKPILWLPCFDARIIIIST